ncbi:MAG: hypothetical protein R6U28_05235 [Cyclonatronaceae bacterium]
MENANNSGSYRFQYLIPGAAALFLIVFATIWPSGVARAGGPEKLHMPSDINMERERFERRAMTTLMAWGAANTAAGTALLFTDWNDGGLMTLSWGAINAGIAFFSLRGLNRLDPGNSGLDEFLRREQRFQRIVAVNAGLNVSYITAGLMMGQYGNQSRTRQFGTAVAVQGAFLLAFDSYLLYRSTRYLDRVMPLLQTTSFARDNVLLLPGLRFSF